MRTPRSRRLHGRLHAGAHCGGRRLRHRRAQRPGGARPVAPGPVRPQHARQHHRRRQRRPRRSDRRARWSPPSARHGRHGADRRRGLFFDRRAARRRLHRSGTPDRVCRVRAGDRSRRAASRPRCSASSFVVSTVRSRRLARRLPCPRGRSWRPALVCPRARSPTSRTRPRRRRTPPSRATIIRTTRRPGGFATSSAASSRIRRPSSPSSTDDAASSLPARSSSARWTRRRAWPTSFFTDLPFSGEVNLLTTGAFGTGRDVLRRSAAARRRVHVDRRADAGRRLGRPRGDEPGRSVVVDRGRLVPVSRSAPTPRTSTDSACSYSTQDYQGGNPAALAAATDGSRNVGELYALDRWTISPALAVEYGGRYARYDYLRPGGLLQPARRVHGRAVQGTRASSATVAQRMLAPGAEEFLRQRDARTVAAARAHVRAARRPDGNLQRRARALLRSSASSTSSTATYVVGVRRFYQRVDDQLVTLFGLQRAGRAAVGGALLRRERGLARRRWLGASASARTGAARPRLGRLQRDARALAGPRRHGRDRRLGAGRHPLRDRRPARRHDLGRDRHPRNGHARVRALQDQHRLRARRRPRSCAPASMARFDVQVNQALPFVLRRHAVGSARRPAQPVPRSERSRRPSTTSCSSSGRPSAWSAASSSASERPLGPPTGSRGSSVSCKRCQAGRTDPPFFAVISSPGFLDRVSGLLEADVPSSAYEVIARQMIYRRSCGGSTGNVVCFAASGLLRVDRSSSRSPVNRSRPRAGRRPSSPSSSALLVPGGAEHLVKRRWTEMEDGVLWESHGSEVVAAEIVAEDSPASRAGIQRGDVLLADRRQAQVAAAGRRRRRRCTRPRPGPRLDYVVLRQRAISSC